MSSNDTSLTITSRNENKGLSINNVLCIGYSGRNQEKVKEHIEELAELGVPRPEQTPTLFPMRLSSLNTTGKMEVIGDQTSGEAELVFIYGDKEEEVYVTVGSDHTDRELETVHIGKSKQVCDKPLASKVWPVKDVIDHWDELVLKTEIKVDGQWQSYQNEKVAAIMPYEDIKENLKSRGIELPHSVFFAGTVPLLDGFKFGEAYEMSLEDPIKGDSIILHYEVQEL
ncbi:DUF2848 family protein [Bacillus sp. FJAT-44742]|uniref:DUF2848 family protein n=1 Tax=Bacillus sp. FJAT-44742 TaxID=2014005 RepID=UPI000C244A2C|nr:DUF2848 family protein [Bacillus sp. FJAT-44742]